MLALGQRPVVDLWDEVDDERHKKKRKSFFQRNGASTKEANAVSLKHAKELRGAARLMAERGYD